MKKSNPTTKRPPNASTRARRNAGGSTTTTTTTTGGGAAEEPEPASTTRTVPAWPPVAARARGGVGATLASCGRVAGRAYLDALGAFDGAVGFSQGADDYLDDDTEGKGLLADHTAADEGKPYTALEHAWDEGFGYFGGARNYLLYTDEEIAGEGGRDDADPAGGRGRLAVGAPRAGVGAWPQSGRWLAWAPGRSLAAGWPGRLAAAWPLAGSSVFFSGFAYGPSGPSSSAGTVDTSGTRM